jgi:hypothetical protein
MKQILTVVLFVSLSFICLANVAMPGMWSAGHGSTFYPLFASDSIYFGKIRMQKELVLVNLYPGFAAVKGEYWMYNSTAEAITMHVAYPVNGTLTQEPVHNVMFDSLYAMKALINGQPVSIASTINRKVNDTATIDATSSISGNDWYFWRTTFAPNTITKITVYFLTNNSNAVLRQGYDTEKGNAFSYILESGRAWGGTIDSGRVLIQLCGGLKMEDMMGVMPANAINGNEAHLEYSFNNLEPMPANNLLLWYKNKDEQFNFDTVLQRADTYLLALDRFPVQAFNKGNFKKIEKSDFKVFNTTGWVIGGVAVVVVVLILGAIGLVVFLLYRLFNKKKRPGK